MKLPEALATAYETGYREFSWIAELPQAEDPLTLFSKSQHTYKGQRFYWQTPAQELTLIGCGQLAHIIPSQLTDLALTQFMNDKQQTIYTNRNLTGTGPLLFGGLPFNQDHPEKTLWGPLDQGLFYLPALMVSFLEGVPYITLNFKASSLADLTDQWQLRQKELQAWLEAPLPLEEETAELRTTEINLEKWLTVVEQTVAAIKEKSSLKKVVLARQLAITNKHPWQSATILKRLAEQQQATYLFALEKEQHLFIGASPERLLQGTEADYTTACIAGSIARGNTPAEDDRLGQELLMDEKNQLEHQIVVDQIARDFQQMIAEELVIQPATLLKNRDIQHLHVPLRGKRKAGTSLLESVKQLHPTPALGGQPKELARDFIAQHEPLGRGMYGGPIGWVSLQNDCGEFAVGIRSAILSKQKGCLYAGCGIVADSAAEAERQETAIKFQPMLRALD
ncbi:isochorismate synthase [Vagococcus sp. BWB3-3]|uniref:isochorismate synthase n=1 Tax=Vagococcus allomyrinae TaxID=2794353 RepID=A0A940P291_9ENTE|nr:isochorismate synthase [Vagococcus allomyrinae]MBP1039710.1 isochorismate synthase [Vagococcus allomyrinae]